jgi:FeS assembly SUF system protein
MPERDTTLMDYMQLTDQPMPQSGDLVAQAGAPREDGSGQKPDRMAIEDALRQVYDPEIPVNIFDLGLIYEIYEGQDGTVELTMTLTAPGCPVAGILPQQVADAVASVEGVGEVFVTLTWEPAWNMEMMSEDARMALGMF